MPTHLLDHASAAYAVETTVATDFLQFGDASDANATKITTIANLVGIQAANTSIAPIAGLTATDVQAALAEHQVDITALQSLTGTYVGASATVAAFATTDQEGNAIGNGDWAILSVDDGTNKPGIWVHDGTAWALAIEIPDIAVMVGATASAAGASGLAPAPLAGQQNFVLTGGGVYADPALLVGDFGAATPTVAGTTGLVPAPAAGDEVKFLTGAGTYVGATAASLQAVTDVGLTTDNDMEFTDTAKGLIFLAPDGTRWRTTINNAGALVTAVA